MWQDIRARIENLGIGSIVIVLLIYCHIYEVSQTIRTSLLSRKQSILEKNFRQKGFQMIYLMISLTLGHQEQCHFEFFKWNSLFFIAYSCSTPREFSKIL